MNWAVKILIAAAVAGLVLAATFVWLPSTGESTLPTLRPRLESLRPKLNADARQLRRTLADAAVTRMSSDIEQSWKRTEEAGMVRIGPLVAPLSPGNPGWENLTADKLSVALRDTESPLTALQHGRLVQILRRHPFEFGQATLVGGRTIPDAIVVRAWNRSRSPSTFVLPVITDVAIAESAQLLEPAQQSALLRLQSEQRNEIIGPSP